MARTSPVSLRCANEDLYRRLNTNLSTPKSRIISLYPYPCLNNTVYQYMYMKINIYSTYMHSGERTYPYWKRKLIFVIPSVTQLLSRTTLRNRWPLRTGGENSPGAWMISGCFSYLVIRKRLVTVIIHSFYDYQKCVITHLLRQNR